MEDQQGTQNENTQPKPQQPIENSEQPKQEATAPQAAQPQDQPVETPAPEQQPAPESTPEQAQESTPEAQNQQQTPQNQQVQPPEFMKKAADQPATKSEERIWALLSYIPLLALLSLIMKPDSEFVKLHGRQGLLIFLIFFFSIFVYLIPFIGWAIGALIHFACIGIGLFSMFQAFIGNWWKIPILGDVAELLPVEAFAKVTRTAVMSQKVDEEKRAEEQDQQPPVETPPPADESMGGEQQKPE